MYGPLTVLVGVILIVLIEVGEHFIVCGPLGGIRTE